MRKSLVLTYLATGLPERIHILLEKVTEKSKLHIDPNIWKTDESICVNQCSLTEEKFTSCPLMCAGTTG